ncbi:S41 family peptidase [Streptosporangium sp. NPDC000563]|uniref:S41 family peptidase n=1 Tax=Streptosporangium sp. NPDC000563 TaxID=3154366 RepID=UPI003326BDE0
MRSRKSFVIAIALAALIGSGATGASADRGYGGRPPACVSLSGPSGPSEPPPLKPTTVTTLEQAYHCVFANYYSGPVLDPRALLVPAFTALTQELQRRGLDRPNATMPALTGDKKADWAAFSAVYQKVVGTLPADPEVRQAVAEATMRGMVRSLDDNHANWDRPTPGGLSLGARLSGIRPPGVIDPAATPPLFVTDVRQEGPAAKAGIRPGDELVSVDGVPLFVNGVLSQGVLDGLIRPPAGKAVRLTLRRPSTGGTVDVSVTPAPSSGSEPKVESKLLSGSVAYVALPGFFPGAADKVLEAIASLREKATLRGVVLDLRGNGGGSPQEVSRLLGAWTHGKVTSYWCDVHGRCTANRSDDTVPLLGLPLVALTDRNCASACDSFTSTVKDLRLGTLVGTRTAGAVSGPGAGYLLDDGSVLILPKKHEIGANREVVNTIGVAPDHQAPMTSADLSAGRDPGVTKALTLLK